MAIKILVIGTPEQVEATKAGILSDWSHVEITTQAIGDYDLVVGPLCTRLYPENTGFLGPFITKVVKDKASKEKAAAKEEKEKAKAEKAAKPKKAGKKKTSASEAVNLAIEPIDFTDEVIDPPTQE